MKLTLRMVVIASLLALSMILAGASGCTGDDNLAVRATEDALRESGIDGYDPKEGDAKKLTTRDSESHQMIAKMRFLEYDMSPNLEDYRGVYLVDMTDENGNTMTAVCYSQNGEVLSLLPKSSTGK
ncbi:MAG: hypothetical protein CVT60_03225 [Actinobacteria bacterium HGW-Actinobacteria-10]|jgi:hypothetical protein|nr:MAG: hypothetical protein CVT60_03225 [Actinobacteria bacterium HGW-Actinobacteria-10]